MPYEARIMMKEGETLLSICLDTHMSTTGSSDALSADEYNRNLDILRTAVSNWKVGNVAYQRFDDAVLELCNATILEAELSDLVQSLDCT